MLGKALDQDEYDHSDAGTDSRGTGVSAAGSMKLFGVQQANEHEVLGTSGWRTLWNDGSSTTSWKQWAWQTPEASTTHWVSEREL